MTDDRLPTALYLDAHFRQLTQDGIFYTILNSGAPASGTVLLKIFWAGNAKLLQQQRNQAGVMGWLALFEGQIVEETRANDYIRRALDRDPDLWVIEVEQKSFKNPFEGDIF